MRFVHRYQDNVNVITTIRGWRILSSQAARKSIQKSETQKRKEEKIKTETKPFGLVHRDNANESLRLLIM